MIAFLDTWTKIRKARYASHISTNIKQLLNAIKQYRTSDSCLFIDKIVRDSLLFDQYQLINFLNSVKK